MQANRTRVRTKSPSGTTRNAMMHRHSLSNPGRFLRLTCRSDIDGGGAFRVCQYGFDPARSWGGLRVVSCYRPGVVNYMPADQEPAYIHIRCHDEATTEYAGHRSGPALAHGFSNAKDEHARKLRKQCWHDSRPEPAVPCSWCRRSWNKTQELHDMEMGD